MPSDLDINDGTEVVLGVRPHDIDLTPGGEGIGRVEIVEPLGPATVIHLRVDGLTDTLVRVVAPADLPVGLNDEVGFSLRRDRLHVFDGRTGLRLG